MHLPSPPLKLQTQWIYKVKQLLFFSFFGVFIIQFVNASPLTDSLYIAWNNETELEAKFDIGEELLWKYIEIDLDRALKFSGTLLIYGEKIGGKYNWDALYAKALILKRKGRDDEALDIFLMLEKQAIENKWDNKLGRIWDSLGALYQGLENWPKTIFYLEKAADILAETNSRKLIMVLSNLTDAYITIGDTLTAKNINLEMLNIAERDFDPKVVEHILEWSKELSQNFSKTCLYSLSELDKILNHAQKSGSSRTMLHFFLSKMDCLLDKGKFQELIEFAENTQEQFELYDDIHINIEFFKTLEIAYVHEKQWKKSYRTLAKYDSLRFVLFNEEKRESMDQQDLRYQNENLELQAASILKEKQQAHYLNIVLVSLGICSLFIFFLLWVDRERKQKIEKQQMEHQIWQLQFNPHFFFNALTSIQAFLYEENSNKAIKAINRLAAMFRQTLSRSELEWTDLNSELEFLQEYVTIHKFMSGDEFEFEMEIDESIKKADVQVPPFLLQPIVENAIKHGFNGNTKTGAKLFVELLNKDGEIKTNIRNNGNKFKVSTKVKSSSLGLKITDKRLQSYKQSKGVLIQNNLRNQENWVEVSFSLPFRVDSNKN